MDEADRGAAGLHRARRHAEGIDKLSEARKAEQDGAGSGLLPALLSLRGIVAFWVLYGLVHAALRYSVSHTLTIDDSRANELTQELALGYQLRQPPLYEWILWCVQQVLGTGIASHLFVRYSLIALIGITTFGAVRAAVKDERWAAAASLSLVFAYPVAWTFHEWATQTLLLCSGCMLTIHGAIRFFERPGLRAAVLLGLGIALGLQAKFSFPLMLGGLLLAVLSMAETRRKLADARLLVALLIPALALAPYALWVMQVRGDIVANISTHLVPTSEPYIQRAAYGLWRLAVSIPTFLLPWIAVAGLLAPAAFVKPAPGAPAASMAERLAFRAMAFAVLIAAAGVLFSGATNISARYMHPILFIVPVFVFARIVRLAVPPASTRVFAATALIFAAAMFAVRVASVTDNPFTQGSDRALLLPYEEVAKALTAHGLDRGTVVGTSVREAGNLRAFLPQLRVTGYDTMRVVPPPRREGGEQCVLVWPEVLTGVARRMAEQPVDKAVRIEVPERTSGLVTMRQGVWFAMPIDPKLRICDIGWAARPPRR